jgi:hypothetical protein
MTLPRCYMPPVFIKITLMQLAANQEHGAHRRDSFIQEAFSVISVLSLIISSFNAFLLI